MVAYSPELSLPVLASQVNSFQPEESAILYALDKPILPARYDDFEPGVACGPGDRKAMRAEVPILGDQEEELRPPRRVRCGGRRRLGFGPYGIGNGHWERAGVGLDAAVRVLPRQRHLSNAFFFESLAQSNNKLGLEGAAWRAFW